MLLLARHRRRADIAVLLAGIVVLPVTSCKQNDSEISLPIVVPYGVQDIVFTQNSGCIDTLGTVAARAYVYANFTGKADDVDGQQPDPTKIISQPSKVADKYVFDLPFESAGKYRVAVTCQGSADDPAQDDATTFFSRKGNLVVIGNVDAFANGGDFPPNHINASSNCDGCHTVGIHYQIAEANHAYVNGVCADCHTSGQ